MVTERARRQSFRRHVVHHRSHVDFNCNEHCFPRLETTEFEPAWCQTIELLNLTVVFIKCDTVIRDLCVNDIHCFDLLQLTAGYPVTEHLTGTKLLRHFAGYDAVYSGIYLLIFRRRILEATRPSETSVIYQLTLYTF